MTGTVWKFPVFLQSEFTVDLPEGAQVLHVDMQHGQCFIWALCDPSAAPVPRGFVTATTGSPINRGGELTHVATLLLEGGGFVVHLFEVLA